MNDKLKTYSYMAIIEKEFEWDKWVKDIPFIKLDKDMLFSPIPPFGGAVSRFRVRKAGYKNSVSVYLDCYDRLGIYGSPYWEVYPYEGDIGRCDIGDIKTLLKMIRIGLKEVKE